MQADICNKTHCIHGEAFGATNQGREIEWTQPTVHNRDGTPQRKCIAYRPIYFLFYLVAYSTSLSHNIDHSFSQLYVCEKILEEQGVFGYVKIKTLEMEFLPLDRDIISMEMDFFYTSYFLVSSATLYTQFVYYYIHVHTRIGDSVNMAGFLFPVCFNLD